MSDGGDFGPVIVIYNDDRHSDTFPSHSLSVGWFVGYDGQGNWQKKIPRDEIKEVLPKDGRH
jgi:hypothetical protein